MPKLVIPRLQDLDIRNKRVFVRVDFNVPLKPKADGGYEVADTTRIVGALDTIKFIMDAGGKCILASHLGRPKGKPDKKYSLEPVGQKLSELLNKDVILSEDCIGDGPKGLSFQMRPSEVLLLENLRFHAGEEENSPVFTARLHELCDVYISDAFGTLHRAHASTVGLPKLAAVKGGGFLIQKELHFLEPLKQNPERPFYLIMGGAKVSDKIGVLEHFIDKVDKVFIGGAMAYAFLKARGFSVGKSFCDDKQVDLAARLIRLLDVRKVKLCLPVDHVTSVAIDNTNEVAVTQNENIGEGKMGLDIGPKTTAYFEKELEGAKLIFWNGPMGVFENSAFAQGTFALAKAIASIQAKKIVGGGDSVSAVRQAGVEDSFDFISTGGGATLEYIEGKEMPGIKALEILPRGFET